MKNKTARIYCVYHDKNLVKKHKLDTLDPSIYTLYYTRGHHINSLDSIEKYICEFTAQYYVLKNNLKSDYVGFCHYRRVLNLDIDNFIQTNGISAGFTTNEESWYNFQTYRFVNFLADDFEDYIKNNYEKTSRIYKTFITDAKIKVPYYVNEIYLCKWEYFEEIVGFISGFIHYIMHKNFLYDDYHEWHYFILDNFIDNKLTYGMRNNETWWFENNCQNFWRVIANYIELVEGIYFGHLTKELGLPEYKVNAHHTGMSS